MTVSLFIGIVTILHLVAYFVFIYWTTKLKPSGNPKDGEIIDHTWDGDLQELNYPATGWLIYLFYFMLVVGIGYLVLYPGVFGYHYKGLLNWSEVGQYNEESAQAEKLSQEYFSHYANMSFDELIQNPEAMATGRRIFLQNCAMCHGQNAQGAAVGYPDLTDNDWIWGGSEASIIATITNGRNTIPGQGMPPGGALINVNDPQPDDDHKLEAVANYVLQLGGRSDVNPQLAEEGKALYDRSCIACHGANGEGNQLLGGPNLTDDIWLYSVEGSVEDIKHQIISPTNNVMPAWKDWLSPERIRIVAAYVYSLSHQE